MRGVHSLSVAAAAIALTAVLSGCGGGGGAKAATKDDCKTSLRAAAEAKTLARLYAAGKLGSSRHVRAQASKAHPFILPDGKMIAYDRMTTWQRVSFNEWAASPQVDRVARNELEDADRAAAREAQARCG